MVGHIALPEMSRKLCPGIQDKDIKPATMAPELLTGLLREDMGFNGVVITDATTWWGILPPPSGRTPSRRHHRGLRYDPLCQRHRRGYRLPQGRL